MRYFVHAAVALVLFASSTPAQAPKPPAKKGGPLDQIDGYKKHTIQGFTVLVSDDVGKADTAKYDRKPMDVLELELKMIADSLNKKTLDTLRKVLIWVEWDERQVMNNGRAGGAVAVYYGGHQATMLAEGRHPLMSKAVVVKSLRSLTGEHQPKSDAGRCVLLHELAHAVHDLLLGFDNADVKAAYQQAMERKLYDKGQYVATNDAEYFAELTTAYFDQLGYFPNTRAELKKHDPSGYKVIDAVWSGSIARKPTAVKGKAKPLANNGADKFELDLTPTDVRFNQHFHGPKVDPAAVKNTVLVVAYWSRDNVTVLPKLAELCQEMRGYGVSCVASMAHDGLDPARAKDEMDRRGIEFTSVGLAYVTEKGANRMVTQRAPHTLVFDATGACVFRGSMYDAASHVRAAVGRKILADLGKSDTPGIAKPAESLTGGEPLAAAVAKFATFVSSSDADTATDAKAVIAAILAPATADLAEVEKLRKSDPVSAFVTAERIAAGFKGTSAGTKAADLVLNLRNTQTVQTELKARKSLEDIAKIDGKLSALPGGFDPGSPRFRSENAAAIKQLRAAFEKMQKQFPNARATAEADKIVKPYGE